MATYHDETQPQIAAIEADDRRYLVSVRVMYDGIEYLGRLYFSEEGWEDAGMPDRGVIPARTKEEVLALARRFSQDELRQRLRRAQSERRRFGGMRRATDDMLKLVRYLNQVAISMRAGLLDMEGAAQEIALTEQELHKIVDELKRHAGVEE